jgi:hypothetical protein
MFYRESCSAGSKESGGHGDGSDHQISKAKACKIVGFSRSAFYKSTVDWAAKDAPVIDALNEIIAKRARWGFWKCFNDPLKTCTGHTIGEINHEYDDGRRYQEVDCQAQGGFGDGDYSRKDFDLGVFPRL